ncbi:hypothetical protein [Bradyrhizobium sp. CCBAU 25338]|uniref:hypothetical protein n=1 Tax=Bradyrhizobium sp. CCBAU 25338 TaxID=1641877 RepID=UPI0023025DE1|nr:hypothetical protein [Bradyrhizobium sp. CCBAU 25338]MDA9529056.1 hypothetical protein [Bradyrhizobium sp. CCBAU 25338]
MSNFAISERVRLSIELALTAGALDPLRRQQQNDTAKSLGMTGAEVDVARRGSSFDAMTSIAVALALASRQGAGHLAIARERALRAGISEEICLQIQAFTIPPFDSSG